MQSESRIKEFYLMHRGMNTLLGLRFQARN